MAHPRGKREEEWRDTGRGADLLDQGVIPLPFEIKPSLPRATLLQQKAAGLSKDKGDSYLGWTLLLIGLAGFAGAVLRFWLSGQVGRRWNSPFPLGTFLINITGAFALGLLAGLSDQQLVPKVWYLMLGTGLLGAFTTFSTWMLESTRLIQSGKLATAAANVVGSVIIGLAAAGAGWAVAAL